jgi:hypothetical protein
MPLKSLISACLLVTSMIIVSTYIASFLVTNVNKATAETFPDYDQYIKRPINHPSGWQEIKGNSSDNIVIFRNPAANTTGVGIYATPLPYSKIPLNELNEIQIKSLNQSYNLISDNSTFLSNTPAHQAIYSDPSKGTTSLEIWTIKNDVVFKIIYMASSNYFVDYFDDAKSIIRSFQFR